MIRHYESEGRGFQSQALALVEAEHEVHVLDGLPYGSLQEVVDAGNHEQLVGELLHIDNRLVRVDDLLHVGTLRDEVREGSVAIVVGIDALHVLDGEVALGVSRDEDAARETASLRYEEDAPFVTRAQLLHGLVDFQQVLVREGLIDGDVVVAPGEMGRSAGLLPCPRAAGDAVYVDVAADDACLQRGQHGELDAGSEAARVGEVEAALYHGAVRLRQTIYEVVPIGNAEVLRQVDDPDACWYLMLLQELPALAVTKAEEDYIHLVEGHLRGEAEVGLAEQALVHLADGIAGIRLAVGKDDLRLRMPQQDPDQLAASIAGGSKYSYSYHYNQLYLSTRGASQRLTRELKIPQQGKANATARKGRCYSKEKPMLQQGESDASRGVCRRPVYLFSSGCAR